MSEATARPAAPGWPARSAAPPLGADEVHVWSVRLDVGAERLDALGALLDADESARAARLVTPRHQRRFTVARGVLREVLGAYLGEAPAAVRLAYGARGKPRLAAPPPHRPLQFNVAHTADLALVAVTLGRAVGADVERERPIDHVAVSRRMFSPAERAALLALPPARQRAAFFECWAYKESYVKAHGDGLAADTCRFDAWRPGRADGDRTPVVGDDVAGRWEVVALPPLAAHPAAVCAEGAGWGVVRGEWVGPRS
ncbi:MAG: 4'-phosphopantetheinyl transferase family protein [Gemmatimonadaceae bacterium]